MDIRKVGLVAVFCLMPAVCFAADDTAQLKQQVTQLQAQVEQLQQQLAQKSDDSAWAPYSSAYAFDPFREMELMHRQMNRMMQGGAMPKMDLFQANVDMDRTDTQYTVTIDLPGMEKDNINVEVKDGVLQVSGDRTSTSEENKGGKYFRKERSFGRFMQNVALPDDAKADRIEAQYNNGVLKVVIPREKQEEPKVQAKKIPIK